KTALLLNIYEAHLDYHKTMENYKEAKFNIFKNQKEEDYLIYNKDDATIVDAVKKAKAQLIPFTTKEKELNGAWASRESLYFKEEKIMDKKDIVLVGDHNLENILAAI